MTEDRPEITGGWCWFQEPRVLATEDATFLGWTEYDTSGTVSVARFDHERREFDLNREVGTTGDLAPDDHNAPALYVRRDGHVVVFYTAHNQPDGNRYRVSEEPYRIDSFGEERSLPDDNQSTYPIPLRVDDPKTLFYFYRDTPGDGGPGTFYYYRSGDDGDTWSPRRRLFEIEGDDYSGYIKVAAGDGRLDFCFSRHPQHAELSLCGIGHFHYDVAANQFRDSHGSRLQPPIREPEMTRLFDAEARGRRGWIWDVSTDGDAPAIVFVSFPDEDPTDQRYHYAKYVDGSWRVSAVVDTDHLYATNTEGALNEPEYAPGISLGQSQGDDVLYLSRDTLPRDDKGRGLSVERWRVGQEYDSLELDRVVAGGEDSNQFRPVAPRSSGVDAPDSPVCAVWMCCQSRAPYHYHDETETLKLKAEIESSGGTEIVRMDDWEAYSG